MQARRRHRARHREKRTDVVLRAPAHQLERRALLPADVRREHPLDDLGGGLLAGDPDRVDVTCAIEALAEGALVGACHVEGALFFSNRARVKGVHGEMALRRLGGAGELDGCRRSGPRRPARVRPAPRCLFARRSEDRSSDCRRSTDTRPPSAGHGAPTRGGSRRRSPPRPG